jgi:hypothetical protein
MVARRAEERRIFPYNTRNKKGIPFLPLAIAKGPAGENALDRETGFGNTSKGGEPLAGRACESALRKMRGVLRGTVAFEAQRGDAGDDRNAPFRAVSGGFSTCRRP